MSDWGWPQYTVAGLYILILALTALLHGTERRLQWNVWEAIVFNGIFAWVLWMGWFWS